MEVFGTTFVCSAYRLQLERQETASALTYFQERARLNIALIITATITATSAIQRTAASIEPNISAATRIPTATTAMAIPIMSSLNRCHKLKGGDVPGGPTEGREEITICILRFIASLLYGDRLKTLALEKVSSS
jgi:hypothetical protein